MEITLYTSSTCPFCIRAKALLDSKQLPYTEHVMDTRQDELTRVKAEFNHDTVPLILIDGKLVGGNSELAALDAAGRL